MSYFAGIRYADSTNLDAFGRLRVSEPYSLFDYLGEYGDNPILWETATTGTGSVSNVAHQGAIKLSTGGTVVAASAIRQSKMYMRYQPGRSLNIEMTFVMSAAQTNVTTQIGYYDTDNGIFLSRDGTTLNITQRTFTSGSVVNNIVSQSSWNIDKMDGTGPSGITIDVTKAQILFIQLQYLGVGRVQIGFNVGGISYVVHEFLNANYLSVVYMSTGCLPIRGEVINTGTATGTCTLNMICVSVSSGGEGIEEFPFSRSNGILTRATSTSFLPIIAIRAGTLLGGTSGGGSLTNRGHIIPLEYTVYTGTGADHEFQIIYNGTITGGTWLANDSQSLADYNISATSITGGRTWNGGYSVSEGSGPSATKFSFNDDISRFLPLVYSSLNSTQDSIALCIRTLTGTSTAAGVIDWVEKY